MSNNDKIVCSNIWKLFGPDEKRILKDLQHNTEFRIKYPRGELGQSSGEAELFMLVEHIAGLLDELEVEVKSMRNNAVNIEFLQERTKKLTEDVEKLIRNGRVGMCGC